MLANANNKRLKEWMTNGLTSGRRKHYISMKYKKHPNCLRLALYYKKYKINFTKTVRLAKLKLYEHRYKKVSSNLKLIWKLIN